MKFSDLRDAAVADATAAGQAADVLSQAQNDYISKSSKANTSTVAFAAAIVAKGGEVTDTKANPPVGYRSTDGQSVKSFPVVSMDDDAPEAPAPAPEATEPSNPPAQ